MKFTKFLFIALLAVAGTNLTAQTDAVLGAAGVSNVDQDPDNITDLSTIDTRYETNFAWDESNQVFYVYDSNGGADKWKDFTTLLPTVTNTNHRLANPAVSAGVLTFDVIDLENGNAVLGTETINVIDIAPVQSITSGTGITVTDDGSGGFTINNSAAEATTVTDGNTVDLTLTGTDVTAEVVVDPAADNAITSGAAGLKVVVPANLDNDPTNENQTVSSGDGVTVTQTGQDFEVTNSQASKGEFKNHADAGTGGVALGEYFEASTDNTMGMTPGTLIKRKF